MALERGGRVVDGLSGDGVLGLGSVTSTRLRGTAGDGGVRLTTGEGTAWRET